MEERRGCRAILTGKRAAKNYLHPKTLRESRGLELAFGDWDDVPLLVARTLLEKSGGPDRLVSPAGTQPGASCYSET